MAAAVLQPFHAMEHVHRSFKGDNDMLVDRLISASARKAVATDSLVERALVPFFDTSDASGSTFQSLQPRRTPSAPKTVPISAAGHKRHAQERSSSHLAGSPPRKESEVAQAMHARRAGKPAHSQPASSGGRSAGSGSDTEMTSPAPACKPRSGKKHQRDAGAGAKPAAPSGAGQRQSPPRKRPEPALDMHSLATASAAAGSALRTPGGASKPRGLAASKFAGPAFTNSPTPDCLPIPTSSLLLAQAADGLRARLTL